MHRVCVSVCDSCISSFIQGWNPSFPSLMPPVSPSRALTSWRSGCPDSTPASTAHLHGSLHSTVVPALAYDLASSLAVCKLITGRRVKSILQTLSGIFVNASPQTSSGSHVYAFREKPDTLACNMWLSSPLQGSLYSWTVNRAATSRCTRTEAAGCYNRGQGNYRRLHSRRCWVEPFRRVKTAEGLQESGARPCGLRG